MRVRASRDGLRVCETSSRAGLAPPSEYDVESLLLPPVLRALTGDRTGGVSCGRPSLRRVHPVIAPVTPVEPVAPEPWWAADGAVVEPEHTPPQRDDREPGRVAPLRATPLFSAPRAMWEHGLSLGVGLAPTTDTAWTSLSLDTRLTSTVTGPWHLRGAVHAELAAREVSGLGAMHLHAAGATLAVGAGLRIAPQLRIEGDLGLRAVFVRITAIADARAQSGADLGAWSAGPALHLGLSVLSGRLRVGVGFDAWWVLPGLGVSGDARTATDATGCTSGCAQLGFVGLAGLVALRVGWASSRSQP